MNYNELHKMTDVELIALNKVIVALVKQRQKTRAVTAAHTFRTGQTVMFTGKRGTIQGVVTRVKIKMVEVDCGVNGKWNVSGSMLRAI
jgi:hypothetical protein